MKVGEFFAEIVIKGGKAATAEIKGIMSSTIATKAALLAAVTAFYKLSEVARQSAVVMDMYQVNTGLSSEQLQKLSFQASQAGVSMQELGGAIQKLQQANANARLGYGWDPILTRFGLHPGQDPVTQLNRIGEAVRRLSKTNPAEAKALANKAGISDSMYYAMMRGTTEQMSKQLILTNKEKDSLVKLNQQWNKFWFYLKQIGIKIQAISASFQGSVVRVVTRALQGFFELFKRVSDVIDSSEKLKNVILAVGAAIAIAFAPEIAVLSAIVLILEDIFTYFEGGDSITGDIVDWINKSEEFHLIWKGIKDTFKFVYDIVKTSIKGWKDLFTVLNDAGVFKAIMSEILSIFNKIRSVLSTLIDNPIVRWAAEKAGINTTNNGGFPIMENDKLHGLPNYSKFARPNGLSSYGNSYNNATKITAYFQSTGDAGEDGRILGDFQRGVQEASGQSNSLSLGSRNGGMRYQTSGGGGR